MNFTLPLLQLKSTRLSYYLRRTCATISRLQIASDRKTVAVEFDGKEKQVYHAVWLKHLCHCPKCRDPSSGQSQRPPESLRGSYKLSGVVQEGDSLEVSWEDDEDQEHRGIIPVQWLKDNAYGEDVLNRLSKEARPVLLTEKMSEFDYKSLTECNSRRLDWLLKIYEDGLSLLKNVPIEPKFVTKVANFVYSNMSTIHGEYFDVQARKDGVSVAFAERPLYYHMDQSFYESPPGLLLLHCLKYDDCVIGGTSVMVDQLVAAEEFRRDYPMEFDILANTPIILGRISDNFRPPVHTRIYCRHFVLGHNDEIVAVNWNYIHHMGVCAPHHTIEPYYHAMSKWANYIKNFRVQHSIRLSPGDLLIMNNRRVLHSRTDYSLNSGERHLQGTYVNIDEFKSEVLAQCQAQGRPLPKARVGNQDYVC